MTRKQEALTLLKKARQLLDETPGCGSLRAHRAIARAHTSISKAIIALTCEVED